MADAARNVTTTLDVPVKITPALSATSDQPKVEAVPAAEVVADTVDKPVVDKPAAEATSETPAPAEGDKAAAAAALAEADADDGKPKNWDELPPWAKRELTKARNQRNDERTARQAVESRADAADVNLKKALDAVEKLTGYSAAAAIKDVNKVDPKPARETYDNPDKYDDALVEWAGRRAARAATAALEAQAQTKTETDRRAAAQSAAEARAKEIGDSFVKRKDEFAKAHPDYEEIAESDDLKISVPMAAAILEDEDGPAIAYYLGQNPDEAERISGLSPNRAVSELGRIAAKLKTPPPKKEKPAPLNALRGNSAPASTGKDPNEMSMEEYAVWRAGKSKSGSGITTH